MFTVYPLPRCIFLKIRSPPTVWRRVEKIKKKVFKKVSKLNFYGMYISFLSQSKKNQVNSLSDHRYMPSQSWEVQQIMQKITEDKKNTQILTNILRTLKSLLVYTDFQLYTQLLYRYSRNTLGFYKYDQKMQYISGTKWKTAFGKDLMILLRTNNVPVENQNIWISKLDFKFSTNLAAKNPL